MADTINVTIPGDSLVSQNNYNFTVDDRLASGLLLGIQTKKKWRYIPVDQFYVLNNPLAQTIDWYIADSSLINNKKLYIDNLTFWYDRNGLFSKGDKLNGYSYLVDSNGKILQDWQWDFTVKRQRKQKKVEVYSNLLEQLLLEQKTKLETLEKEDKIARFPYRRELNPWGDYIILKDGFIIDARLTLLFPKDERSAWSNGVRGIYFRRSKKMESVGIGGLDQQWFFRKNDEIVLRTGITARIGFNSYQAEYFDTIHWKNILMVHAGFLGSVEYRPRYLRGLHAGAGVYLQVNALPEFVDLLEGGMLMTVGVNLP